MKTKIILSLMGLLFISGAFGEGCEDEEPKADYIKVYVKVDGWVVETDSLNAPTHNCTALCKSFQVKIKIQKDQGEMVEQIKVTDEDCTFLGSEAEFKLYREQPIEVWVRSHNDIPGYIEHGTYDKLTWAQVDKYHDLGDTYEWRLAKLIYLVHE